MSARSRLRRSLCAASLLAAAATALACGPAARGGRSRRGARLRALRGWPPGPPTSRPTGTLRDPLQPGSRGISYGTVMLADTMLSAAAGGGDEALAGAAGSLMPRQHLPRRPPRSVQPPGRRRADAQGRRRVRRARELVEPRTRVARLGTIDLGVPLAGRGRALLHHARLLQQLAARVVGGCRRPAARRARRRARLARRRP